MNFYECGVVARGGGDQDEENDGREARELHALG